MTAIPDRLPRPYRGRLAPSPTGYLHLGHACTFWTAQERARAAGGALVLRNEDLDRERCRTEFAEAMLEDLAWFGFRWDEGPDVGGPLEPYTQSQRAASYAEAFARLREGGFVYPCGCSRREVRLAARAPHAADEEPVYPGTCRPSRAGSPLVDASADAVSWRFRVPDGEAISFHDQCVGLSTFVAGVDFGDFIVWRHDDVASYQLAVVTDDASMGITEVVRGSDLLLSTARQLLLYRALGFTAPKFYHCPLVTDEHGVRLAKRHDVLSLRTLRSRGLSPAEIRESPEFRAAQA